MSSSSSDSQRPLTVFFGQFSHFAHNSRNHASKEIGRLRGSGLWSSVYDDDDTLMDAYRDALTLEFNSRYGTDANDLAAWQALCTRIGIHPIPDSLEECRKVVRKTHLNLVDLVHVHETERTVRKFKDVYKLSAYTLKTHKFFPRDNAHAGNLLKFLLRHIFDPSKNGEQRRGGSSGAS